MVACFDSMAEIPEFLKLHKEFHENIVEAWDDWTAEHNGDQTAQPGPSGAGGGRRHQGAAQTKADKAGGTGTGGQSSGGSAGGTSATGQRKREGGNINDKEGGKKPKQTKKNIELEKALVDATATKKVYSSAMSRAENLVTLIETSSEWAWARTAQSVGILRNMVNKVKASIGENPSMNRFILEDIKDLKRDVGAEALLGMATDFNKIKQPLDDIDSKQASLVAGHKTLKA